ncbi:interferon-induced very large GTPase 1-like isoform X15 [Dendronephthya gigantea]|uniref:interferon-induced very large GTPase 1-like isoform X15 n=1 Tax=Dendronephthya gigantea TaxID=151771 RepID=UPI00106B9B4F|nr:interferon-induced very large GTPase 1-like isoform X15 [Dendronephthya gigantea]
METEMDENKDSSSSESLYSSDDDSSVQCLPKYTLREARTIDNHTLTDKELTCTDQIPKYILNKLMIGDYRAREFKVKPLKSSKIKTKDAYGSDDSDDEQERVNPMDALLLLFHLSDECLRQHLALKLDECQLSVPFLLPHPEAPTEKVTILLRALENITKFCRSDASNDKKRTQEVFATEHPFPVVSFIRIGDITMSKSSLINKIMSDGNEHHDFFFHNDVKDPDVYRKIVDGCVELSWYLPGGREKQTLETDICFVNLRGDARVFKKQFRLILKISSVLCILLPSNYQDQTITEILKEATYSPANIILLFNEIRCLDSVEKYFDDMKINHRGKMSLLTNTKKFDEDYFIQKMRINIQKKIHEVKPTPLTELESCAKKFGFHLDGNESHFTLRKTVDSWLGMGIKEAKIRLKLQMHVPALADLEREKYFSNHDGRTDHIGRDIDKIYKAIEEVKTAQKQSFAHLDERIVHFLNSIAEMNTTERNCTLNKMKHELNKMSLQVMPELHQEYRLALLKNRDKQAQVWKHLQQLEESITTHSFGLEHIIRELAQLYEIEECKYDYAGAAADMLLSGQPLEILDGDSFYIPLEWFNGVYRELESKTKNAKIFVISVLGIKSSGKSTMLNTMFGLEFPVSAGRCTRGVFASLLPVSDSTKCNSSLEYVLILDSEGFRGSRNHENELGMFVIGAADLTIVNIFGISRDEITQFLDKTVHAFLRMKLLTEKKSCKIVHQNFEAAEEREKIDDVRRNLNQDLDRMTKLAATQENCVEQFQYFNEVVSFDANEDVFYIPSLYQGNSPMAQRRPEYGRAVQRIKENVVTLMCSKEMYKYSISQFREKICNLWEVILRGRVDEISTDEFKKTRRQKIAETKFFHDLIVKPVSKFTLQKARTVRSDILRPEKLTSEDKIPDYIFKMLMIANYHVREFELKPLPSNLYETEDSSECSDDSDNWDDESVNPMDAMLGIFHGSDDTLRRYIVNKLSACQLSVPFLLPDPTAPSENVTILLSALESITKCWKDGTDTKLVFATEHPFPVVSFIRIGKPTMSKSSLINEIMSDGESTHNFFFNKKMRGGHVKRKVVDGLVEVSWFLPSGSEKQTLQNEICFANLRGDARYFKKQLDLLSAISSIIFILLPSEYGEKTGETIPIKFLEEAIFSITNFNGKVTLIFNEKIRQTNAMKYFNDLKSRKNELSSITSAKKQNYHRFLLSIRQKIQVNVNRKESSPLVMLASRRNQDLDKTLAQEVSNLDQIRAKQDDNDPDNTSGKDCIRAGINAHQMSDDDSHELRLEFEMKFGSWLKLEIEKVKDLLKLQKHIPVLAKLIRERYCPKFLSSKSEKSENVNEDVDKIDKNIEREKIAQKETLKTLDEGILNSLNSLATMNEIERNYTVNNLKHYLDKTSLQITTKLREDYEIAKRELRKKEEMSPKSDKESPEEKHLKDLEDTISKYSFGLEHIIRELAQLYQIEESKYDYAGAAADMLLSGQPLEILYGDSFYIPLEWFKAVFTKLDEKTNKAKTFVISIMGIQISGKSTLLNRMFGLEFPVRAVRCKRGAFANLLPVSDSLKSDSGFDYVLIINTEGLEGSADPEIRIHDNQMATFAIGVADVTIVNIMGESYHEIKGFLEIAVHAFLKMNLVEERKMSCKIVHQNVAATDAKNILSSRRSELKNDLDKMTELAATEENCGAKYKKIDDIISFDEHEDVFYIPSLLQRSPPMAPVNPDYGRAVQRVKETIINLMYSEKCLKISFSQFQDRVCKLWESMLRENFIFSFRNVIEVRAFRSLDRKYFNESVKLMVIKMGELQTEIEVALKRCSTQEELVKEWERKEIEILQEAEKFGDKMKEAMNDFFQTDQDKAILEQWRENIMNRITEQKEIQVRQVRRNCESTFNFLQNLQNVEERKQTHKKEFLEKARSFITSTAAVIDDEEKLKAKFEQEWEEWIVGVPKHKEKKNDVNNEMVNVLCNTNPTLNAKMRKKLEKQNYNIVIIDDSDASTSILESAWGYLLGKKRKPWHPEDRRIKYIAKSKALKFAKKALGSGARCTPNNLTQMYHIVITTIDEETNKSGFESSKPQESLKCDILLHVFSESYEIFDEMEERFIQQQDIRAELEKNVRPEFEKYFENACKETEKEKLAAASFVKALKTPFKSALNSTLGGAIASKLMSDESAYKRKGQFHAKALIELGEGKKFESYKHYLADPVDFLSMRLKVLAEKFCLNDSKKMEDNSKPEKRSVFKGKIREIESEVLQAISTANKETESENKKLTSWIQRFVEQCKTLVIKNETFALVEINDLEDIEVYKKDVINKVNDLANTLINDGLNREDIKLLNPSPSDILINETIGCQCVCPFCGVLCDIDPKNHEGMEENNTHATRVHRPGGIRGYFYTSSRKLVTEICTTDVARKAKFKNRDTSEFIPFKDYQSVNDYYKSWVIAPDELRQYEALKYFKWFMVYFSKELAEYYNVEEPDIPEDWKSVTFEDAKKELEQKYELYKAPNTN